MKNGSRSDLWLAISIMAVFLVIVSYLSKRAMEGVVPPPPAYSAQSGTPDGCLAVTRLLEQCGMRPQLYFGSRYNYPERACMVQLGADEMAAMFGGALDQNYARLWLERGGVLVLGNDGMTSLVLDSLLESLEPDAPLKQSAVPELAPETVLASQIGQGSAGEPSAMLRAYRPSYIYQLPTAAAPLWSGLERLEAATPDSSFASAKDYKLETLLAVYDSAASVPEAVPVLHFKPVGAGGLYILSAPEMMTNGWLGRAENHRFALALLSLASDGRELYFDEGALGYSNQRYNGLTVITKTRGGQLLLCLAAVLALFWLGSAIMPARVAPATLPPRRQVIEMVLAQAALLQHAGARHTVASALVEGLRRHCSEGGRMAVPSDDAISHWARQAALEGRLNAQQRADISTLTRYLGDRYMPRSGAEVHGIGRACDLLIARLRRGDGPAT